MFDISRYSRDTVFDSPYIPCRKNAANSAILQGLTDVTGGILGFIANKDNNKSNMKMHREQLDFAAKQYEKEREYNTWLLQNQKQLQMQDAKAAGANPAFAQGSLLGGMSSGPTSSIPSPIPNQAPDFSWIGRAGTNVTAAMRQDADLKMREEEHNKQMEYMQEQINSLKKDNRNKELDIADRESENDYYKSHNGIIVLDIEGPKGQKDSITFASQAELDEYLENWKRNHPGRDERELLDNVHYGSKDGSKGYFEARKASTEWSQQLSRYINESEEFEFNRIKREVDKAVAIAQRDNPEYVKAVANMPVWAYKELLAKVTALGNENELFEWKRMSAEYDAKLKQLEFNVKSDKTLWKFISNVLKTGDIDLQDLLMVLIIGASQYFGIGGFDSSDLNEALKNKDKNDSGIFGFGGIDEENTDSLYPTNLGHRVKHVLKGHGLKRYKGAPRKPKHSGSW